MRCVDSNAVKAFKTCSKPTRLVLQVEVQTLTDRAGGVGQCNIPLFTIERRFSKIVSDLNGFPHSTESALLTAGRLKRAAPPIGSDTKAAQTSFTTVGGGAAKEEWSTSF